MGTIEQQVSETLLQQTETIMLGKHKYKVAKPTIATLIATSASISEMPQINISEDNVVADVLRNAKDTTVIGKIVATMVVGVRKGVDPLSAMLNRIKIHKCQRRVLNTLTPSELIKLVYQLFGKMQLSDFFGLIAFLSGVNIAKPTKATTTASGQQ